MSFIFLLGSVRKSIKRKSHESYKSKRKMWCCKNCIKIYPINPRQRICIRWREMLSWSFHAWICYENSIVPITVFKNLIHFVICVPNKLLGNILAFLEKVSLRLTYVNICNKKPCSQARRKLPPLCVLLHGLIKSWLLFHL